jgi:hypothetical protein
MVSQHLTGTGKIGKKIPVKSLKILIPGILLLIVLYFYPRRQCFVNAGKD